MASASGDITYEQVCRIGESPLPRRVCWSGTAGVFPHRYVIPYAINVTSGVEDRARYSLRDALPRCLALRGGCGAVACDSRPRILPPFPNRAAQCTLRRNATSENTELAVCMPASTSTEDDGYVDTFRGWYDVQSCGRCLDYCRWVGNSGSGGDPADRLVFETSWWSCRLAGSDESYTLNDTFSSWPHRRCSGENAASDSDAFHESTFEATYQYLCDDLLV